MSDYIKGANPYMPLWEHVPDGEPRVFEYEGERRVYVYGSHDTERNGYCGRDYVVWSAPADDLSDWKCHGICYTATDGSVLFAPDVVKKGDTYYLYAAEACGSRIMVAKSSSPTGPFTDPVLTELGFDPSVLVDVDGKIYAYWGFCKSFAAEMLDDMAHIKRETLRENFIGHTMDYKAPDDGHADETDAFFEASSIRRVMGKYVFIYSKRYFTPVPEYGICTPNNGFLTYKYSDSPLDGYSHGGDIIFNGGEILKNSDGTGTMTYRWGNNHGSIAEINGEWYVFYHRQTGVDEYSRQAMAEPIGAAIDKDGRLYLGEITYRDGIPVASRPVEMTSSGMCRGGIDAYKIISAGYACHIYGGAGSAYIKPVYDTTDSVSAPVVNIKSGTTVGFRYLSFGDISPRHVTVEVIADGDVTVNVRADKYDGEIIASMCPGRAESVKNAPITSEIVGRHAVYFEFLTDEDVTAEFVRFSFDREGDEDAFIQNAKNPHGIGGDFFIEKMNRGGHAALAKWGLFDFSVPCGGTALDVGCGGGANVERLLSKYSCGRVVGIDISPLSVEKSREYNKDAILAGRCEILRGDVSALPFEDGTFDVATAFETIYFWDIERGLSEVFRVLKNGGRFLICNDTDGETPDSKALESRVTGMRIYAPDELLRLLKAAGFSDIRVRRIRARGMICFDAAANKEPDRN
ncbi:MAG: methyltransferase domain-containing protein [Firmicutes bacterium]|nr:methyltransferase domain-containing protein [Bacillota bacterium]